MKIGVFFGSRSTEHDVSIITGALVASGLRGLGHDVVPVYLTRQGEWMIGGELGSLKSFTNPEEDVSKKDSLKKYFLDLEASKGKLVFKRKGLISQQIQVDLAFPAFHGAYGEDGTIQGFFEMFSVPYVGCDVCSSALAMDKALSKQVCQNSGFLTTKNVTFTKDEWSGDEKNIIKKISNLKFPVYVKPVHLGSSIGIAKVKNKDIDELKDRIEVGLYYDDKVLVEESVENLMDVTCCVIGNHKLIASELQESVFHSDLFDFEEKYLKDGGGQFGASEKSVFIPARLDKKQTNEIKQNAIAVYKALGCQGIARVDFLLNKKTREVFVNEINPLPGTLYEHLWRASGIELPELLTKLIDFAIEKQQERKNLTHTFNSSILTSLNGAKGGSKGKLDSSR